MSGWVDGWESFWRLQQRVVDPGVKNRLYTSRFWFLETPAKRGRSRVKNRLYTSKFWFLETPAKSARSRGKEQAL